MTAQNEDQKDLIHQETAAKSNDLDKIINEIEELQQNMDAAMTHTASPKAETPQKTQAPQNPDPKNVVPITASSAPLPEPLPEPLSEKNEAVDEDQSSAEDILKEMGGSSDEPWLEETIAQLNPEGASSENSSESQSEGTKTMSSVNSILADQMEPEEDSEQGGTLSMAIRGKMTIKLNYNQDQFISISVQNETLSIRLADGAELTIPVRTKSLRKAA